MNDHPASDHPASDRAPPIRSRAIRNRGTAENPANRFTRIVLEADPEAFDPDAPRPRTELFRDTSRSVVSRNDSPDIGFELSVNPYRGCEHGCIYCYARPYHEYLGFSAGLDFETRILVKEDAPELLRAEISSPRWVPQVLVLSGVTDPYQPIEAKLRITRRCLEVLAELRHPVAIVTKNPLVRRDIDILSDLARWNAARVYVSVTTLRAELYRTLEPRTCHPDRRLEAIAELAAAGIPTGVMVAPIIPALNDQEIPEIVAAAAKAGARSAHFTMLRLPHAVAGLFERWLEDHCPDRKDKVLSRIRSVRGGALNDPRFGSRMRGEGIFAEQIRLLFETARRKAGIDRPQPELETRHFRSPAPRQLEFFAPPAAGRDPGDR